MTMSACFAVQNTNVHSLFLLIITNIGVGEDSWGILYQVLGVELKLLDIYLLLASSHKVMFTELVEQTIENQGLVAFLHDSLSKGNGFW